MVCQTEYHSNSLNMMKSIKLLSELRGLFPYADLITYLAPDLKKSCDLEEERVFTNLGMPR